MVGDGDGDGAPCKVRYYVRTSEHEEELGVAHGRPS